ncbi:MAG: methyltransferase domain-containing protein [Marinospirillum sp.]|uniref:methyltransferase domain-containing protein n=1 Tax=Marinospirillum sp. TaxID=2183934 RepID=UPI0019FBDEFC|nr:methyltransferase domain-containing protein [Marinospirillum sp.]MBE0505855.1 methyltransferase domain-containing protein [Marinospirillum sp.]
MDSYNQQLSQRYADEHLATRLREALLAEGLNPDQLTLDDIAAIDQLHVGGRRSSRQLADLAEFLPGQQVLDLGCGTGGSSRLLVAEYGVQVVGVDITQPFVDVARWLTEATGLTARCHYTCADAQQLPLETASFDAVWCQHTLMNLPDLDQGLREIHRVLKPDGRLLLHEVLQGGNLEPLVFPVPWADDASTSHLHTPTELEQQLRLAGFTPMFQQNVTEDALNWRKKHTEKEARGQIGILTPQLIFGPRFLQMGKHLMANLQQDKVWLMESVWKKY